MHNGVNINEELNDIDFNLNILSWNIQGIGSKFELDSMRQLFSQYEIIFLFETMKLDTYKPSLSGYQYFHCQRKYQHPRARRPSGGIAVLIKDCAKHIVKIEKLNEHVVWLSIKQNSQSPRLIIGGTYVPPAGSKIYLNSNINDIIQVLQDDISQFLQSTSLVALCGDLNSRTGGLNDFVINVNGRDANDIINQISNVNTEHDPNWRSKIRQSKDKTHNNFGKELIQLCHNSDMRIMNGFLNETNTDDFTCYAPLGKSTVDYLLSTQKLSNQIKDFKICPKLVESDHTPLSFTVCTKLGPSCTQSTQKQPNSTNNKRFCYVFDRHRLANYREILKSEHAQDKLLQISNNISDNANADIMIQTTYDYLITGIEPVFKKKYFKPATNTFPTNAWYDQECKTARKDANEYAKTHDLSLNIHNQQYHLLYKRYKSTIQRKKRQHLKLNRDKLDKLQSTNQTDCWKMWNKLTNTKQTIHNQPDLNTFHDYFTNQTYPPTCTYFDQSHMEEVDRYVHQIKSTPEINSLDSITANICDSKITEDEVALHLKKLKSNKAAGIDGITGEFYKYVADELIAPFCIIFNYIFERGDYPSQWSEGLINALHKKGDHACPDNYRKITITVAMAKIFDSILNSRLYFKNEAMSLDDPFQFGFTPARGTTDCVFVLDTVIKYQQKKKNPVYLCFVDFTKAFDYINRNAQYYKLHKQNMSIKMINIIMSMFDKAQAKVQQQGKLGPPIDSIFGVLQGGILSPKLFNEFMSDLPKYLNIENGIKIEDTQFTHLLYADDIVLLSDTHTGLQNSIDSLHKFCAEWHLIVNITKTKIMRIGTQNRVNFKYNNQEIDEVETFKYLGHIIDNNKHTHRKMSNHVIAQAHKALFALRGKIKPALGHISPTLAMKMFDSYILPILEYNSILWSQNSPKPEIEKVQLGFLKSVINVRKQTPTLAVYAETGRFPIIIRQKLAILKYWARLLKLPSHDILNKCLKIQETLHNNGQDNFYSKVIHIINESNITEWQSIEPVTLVNKIKVILYTNEQSRILNEINNSDRQPKLRSYKLFKTTYCLEPYLSLNLTKKTYSNIARFRLSSHKLKIESGRHEIPKLPLEERKCDKCRSGEIEDELHCLLICSKHIIPRTELLIKAVNCINDFSDLDLTHQFVALMTSKNQDLIKAIGEYLNKVL